MNICSLFIKTLIQNRGEQVGGGNKNFHIAVYAL